MWPSWSATWDGETAGVEASVLDASSSVSPIGCWTASLMMANDWCCDRRDLAGPGRGSRWSRRPSSSRSWALTVFTEDGGVGRAILAAHLSRCLARQRSGWAGGVRVWWPHLMDSMSPIPGGVYRRPRSEVSRIDVGERLPPPLRASAVGVISWYPNSGMATPEMRMTDGSVIPLCCQEFPRQMPSSEGRLSLPSGCAPEMQGATPWRVSPGQVIGSGPRRGRPPSLMRSRPAA